MSSSYGAGVGVGAVGFMSVAFVGIFSSFLIARLYGVKVIGESALVLAPASAVWYLSTAREQAALVRMLAPMAPRAPRVTALFAAVMTFSFTLTTVVASIAMLITYFVYKGPIGHPELFMPALVNMLAYAFLTNTCWNVDMVLSSFRAARQLFWLRLHQIVAYAVLAVGFSFVDSSVWGITLATVLSWVMVTVHRALTVGHFIRWRVPRSELREGFRTLPSMLSFGLRVVPAGIAEGLSTQVPIWTLGVVAPVAAVGAFNRAWLLGQRLVDLNYRVTEMLFPTLVVRHTAGEREGFDRALVETLRLSSYGLLLPAAAGGGAAVGIMRLFGPGFSKGAPALAILLVVPALALLSQCQTQALLAVDRAWTVSKVSMVKMVVVVTSCIFLAQADGITGAAISLVIGCVVDVSIRFQITRRIVLNGRFTQIWPVRTMLATALAYGTGFVAARVVNDVLGGVPGVLAALVAGVVAYVVTLVAAGGILSRDVRVLRNLLGRARKPVFRRPAAAR